MGALAAKAFAKEPTLGRETRDAVEGSTFACDTSEGLYSCTISSVAPQAFRMDGSGFYPSGGTNLFVQGGFGAEAVASLGTTQRAAAGYYGARGTLEIKPDANPVLLRVRWGGYGATASFGLDRDKLTVRGTPAAELQQAIGWPTNHRRPRQPRRRAPVTQASHVGSSSVFRKPSRLRSARADCRETSTPSPKTVWAT